MTREVLLDNSRPENGNKDKQFFEEALPKFSQLLEGNIIFEEIRSEKLLKQKTKVLGIRGGDGTLSFCINEVMKAQADSGEPIVILPLGGGTANTLLHVIKRQAEPTEFPSQLSYLSDKFPQEQYDLRYYRPPQLVFEDGKTQSIAYLYGVCHLSIVATRTFDRLQAAHLNIPTFAYTLAALNTVIQLPRGDLLHPRVSGYNSDDQPFHPLNVTLGAPALGTFYFSELLPQDQLWRLTLEGTPAQVRGKFLRMVVEGVLPGGPDRILNSGLVKKEVLDSVTIYPDLDPGKTYNVNYDGELRHHNGPVTVRRYTSDLGPQGIIFALPKGLYPEKKAGS